MPSRNVYVAEDDLSLFTEASEIAGGLSAAVAEALRDYVFYPFAHPRAQRDVPATPEVAERDGEIRLTDTFFIF